SPRFAHHTFHCVRSTWDGTVSASSAGGSHTPSTGQPSPERTQAPPVLHEVARPGYKRAHAHRLFQDGLTFLVRPARFDTEGGGAAVDQVGEHFMATVMQTVRRFLRPLKTKIPYFKPVRSFLTGAENDQWARVVMNREVRKAVEALPYRHMDALEISGTTWQDFGFQSYRRVLYPDYDICEKPLAETFDLIIAE